MLISKYDNFFIHGLNFRLNQSNEKTRIELWADWINGIEMELLEEIIEDELTILRTHIVTGPCFLHWLCGRIGFVFRMNIDYQRMIFTDSEIKQLNISYANLGYSEYTQILRIFPFHTNNKAVDKARSKVQKALEHLRMERLNANI